MILIIKNQTLNTLSYLSGLVTVSGNSSVQVPDNYIFPISKDSSLSHDCRNINVVLNDGIDDYTDGEALDYLNKVATSIGGAVVGLVGASTPNYAIMVGGKDPSGNVKVRAMDAVGGSIMAGEGVAGTPAGGVLSVQGESGMTPIIVSGDTPSGNTDSGNPVKTGAVFNSNLPTPSTGQRVDSQSNQFGEATVQYRNKYRNLTGNATTTVKSGSGRLHGIMINRNWTGGTITIYDNTANSGTVISTMDIGTPSGGLLSSSGLPGPIMVGPLGLEFSTGLTIVTSGSNYNNITVLYQ